MIVANPIYDVVFKYLMEDERIARTILSALLKQDVVRVEMRPHEYSNDERDSLSVFRIDFGATIRDEKGKEKLILVELQKTWVETETLRFRQYLGVQYRSPRNMRGDNALPMVAVYLLGHKVGDIEEPVLYVNHDCYDYDDNRVEKGLPDPFVESLTHNSIIVQIPRLQGRLNGNTRLGKVLSVFDQSNRDQDDEQVLRLDERAYSNDSDMEHILHRLTMAAADAEMRHRMDVEDEYFSAIEKRDTEILLKEKKLAEQNVKLAEQNVKIVQQDEKIAQQDEKIAQQDEKLAQQDEKLARQQDMLRTSIQLFLHSGMALDEIADKLGKSTAELKQLLAE